MSHEETEKVINFILDSPNPSYINAYRRASEILYGDDWVNFIHSQWKPSDVIETILNVVCDPQERAFKLAKQIVESDRPWEEKYDLIFSTNISRKFSLDYYDPDEDYKDDVMAWWDACQEYMKDRLTPQ
jgi:hypothetical protein